jgi:hypothetical protein
MCSSFSAGVMCGVCVIIYYCYILYITILYYTYYILYYYIILYYYLILYSSLLFCSSPPILPLLSSFSLPIFPLLPHLLFPHSFYTCRYLHILIYILRSLPFLSNPLPNTHPRNTCRYLHILIYILSIFKNNLTPHVLSEWMVEV